MPCVGQLFSVTSPLPLPPQPSSHTGLALLCAFCSVIPPSHPLFFPLVFSTCHLLCAHVTLYALCPQQHCFSLPALVAGGWPSTSVLPSALPADLGLYLYLGQGGWAGGKVPFPCLPCLVPALTTPLALPMPMPLPLDTCHCACYLGTFPYLLPLPACPCVDICLPVYACLPITCPNSLLPPCTLALVVGAAPPLLPCPWPMCAACCPHTLHCPPPLLFPLHPMWQGPALFSLIYIHNL